MRLPRATNYAPTKRPKCADKTQIREFRGASQRKNTKRLYVHIENIKFIQLCLTLYKLYNISINCGAFYLYYSCVLTSYASLNARNIYIESLKLTYLHTLVFINVHTYIHIFLNNFFLFFRKL